MSLTTKMWKKPKQLFVQFTEKELAELSGFGTSVHFSRGKVVFREGDAAGDFFVIQSGRVFLDSTSGMQTVLEPGDFFGELSIFSGMRRTATVKAITSVKLIRLQRRQLDKAMAHVPVLRKSLQFLYARRFFSNVARRSQYFDGMSEEELSDLFSYFRARKLPKDTILTREGGESTRLFILLFGTCAIYKKHVFVRDIGPGHFVGEIGLVRKVPRTATVVAKTDIGVLACTRDHFEKLTERFPNLRRAFAHAASLKDPGMRST